MSMDMSQNRERRQCQRATVSFIVMYRVDAPLTVRMQIGDKEVDAIAVDLSEMGMAVLTNYKIPEAALISLRFIICNDTEPKEEDRCKSIEIGGEVRYNLFTEQKAYRLGIRFIKMNHEQQRFIAQFVKLSLKKGGEAK